MYVYSAKDKSIAHAVRIKENTYRITRSQGFEEEIKSYNFTYKIALISVNVEEEVLKLLVTRFELSMHLI
jgi:hypothetical protein